MDRYRVFLDEINRQIKDNPNFISQCEEGYHNQINEIAEHIGSQKGIIKFVLLAGPSSSGKTTTSKLLSKALMEQGFDAKYISLDDFFLNRDETPYWEDGSKNFETVDAVDWALFDKCMTELLKDKKSKLPTYDFKDGKKYFRTGVTELTDDTIIVVEGLHALNPIIDNFIPTQNSVKVYLSVRADVFDGDVQLLDGNSIRFIRRLIRDLYTRGTSKEKTYAMWKYVIMGEKLYIKPFKNTAKFIINSFHEYELNVYKYILNELAQKGINPLSANIILRDFESLDKTKVPLSSLLQEFVH